MIKALLAIGRASNILPKRRISQISQGATQVPIREYIKVKIVKRGECVYYKGLRYGDRPKKRVVLGQIIPN